MQGTELAVALWYSVASALAFLVYALDKVSARLGGPRVPELALHLLALLGGWPGAAAARQVLRHKSQKASFRTPFLLSIGGNLALLAGALALLPRP